jgi:error-prone DNA polymerase
MVEGKLQKEGEVIHIVLRRCYDLSGLLIPLNNPKAKASEDRSTDFMESSAPGVAKTKKTEKVNGNKAGLYNRSVLYSRFLPLLFLA